MWLKVAQGGNKGIRSVLLSVIESVIKMKTSKYKKEWDLMKRNKNSFCKKSFFIDIFEGVNKHVDNTDPPVIFLGKKSTRANLIAFK